ncbi:hypothetical protein H4Q26_002549 [Puccinia striiformis f. sp. tritici PST-130]|nr:hypothetical protein H4Q26_002549 [Puccinia striiformis f. sp. tritici PST-130]
MTCGSTNSKKPQASREILSSQIPLPVCASPTAALLTEQAPTESRSRDSPQAEGHKAEASRRLVILVPSDPVHGSCPPTIHSILYHVAHSPGDRDSSLRLENSPRHDSYHCPVKESSQPVREAVRHNNKLCRRSPKQILFPVSFKPLFYSNMIIPLFAIFAIFIFLFYKVVAGRRAQAKTLSKDYLEAWHEEWRAGQELKRKEHVAQVERQHAEHSAQDTVRNKQLLALIE